MGRQRVVAIQAEVGGRLVPGELEPGNRGICPLRILGVECSSDIKLPAAPPDAFGDMAAAFPSTNAIRDAGSLAMALAEAGQPVPSSVCCDLPLPVPVASVRWH